MFILCCRFALEWRQKWIYNITIESKYLDRVACHPIRIDMGGYGVACGILIKKNMKSKTRYTTFNTYHRRLNFFCDGYNIFVDEQMIHSYFLPTKFSAPTPYLRVSKVPNHTTMYLTANISNIRSVLHNHRLLKVSFFPLF